NLAFQPLFRSPLQALSLRSFSIGVTVICSIVMLIILLFYACHLCYTVCSSLSTVCLPERLQKLLRCRYMQNTIRIAFRLFSLLTSICGAMGSQQVFT